MGFAALTTDLKPEPELMGALEVVMRQAFDALYFQLLPVRNFIGIILNNIAQPNYHEYVARLFDLDAKISILNQTANKTSLPPDLAYIQNPYYETGGTAFYADGDRHICLTGPLEDIGNRRCLRVRF